MPLITREMLIKNIMGDYFKSIIMIKISKIDNIAKGKIWSHQNLHTWFVQVSHFRKRKGSLL